jgi:hypothetical protein
VFVRGRQGEGDLGVLGAKAIEAGDEDGLD